jgi:hypothetical protein
MMRQLLAPDHRLWRRAVTAGMFAAVLGGTTLAAAVPAASAAPAVHQAPAASQGKVVDKSCQNRAGGVRTCEWLYEWPYKLLNNKYTINVEAYGSMNGKVNKLIKNIYTYGKKAFFAPKHAIAVLAGPGGTGYIAGHDGKRLCSGDVAAGLQPAFTYKYWEPKPISKWASGTAEGSWQNNPTPCNSL